MLLLDEIEKAHPDIFNILLQVMDHATLTDNNGRKADFRQVVLIMTSNAGSREMSAGTIGFWESAASSAGVDARQKAAQQRSKQAIEKVFSPEFRNRLDAIVTFDPLTPAVMETIVEKFVLQLEAQLAERRVAITLEPEARAWLAEKGYDPVFGARPLARVIQTEVRDPLTDEILFGQLEHGGTVTIDLKDGALDFAYDADAARRLRRAVRRAELTSATRSRTQCTNVSTWLDKEHDIPVKVVDRRWWAPDPDGTDDREASTASLQADLRRGARAAARREGQAAAGVHRASTARRRASSRSRGCGCAGRSRRTSSAARREILADLLEVVDNLDRAIDAARPRRVARGAPSGRRDGAPAVPLEARRARRDADRRDGAALRSATARSGHDRPGRDARAGRQRRRRRPSRLPHRRRRAAAGVGRRRERRTPEPAASIAAEPVRLRHALFEYSCKDCGRSSRPS